MNIEQYREMVAQEAQQATQEQQQVDSQVEQTTVDATTQTNEVVPESTTTEVVTDVVVDNEPPAPTIPDVIEIDGKPIPIEELKNGYLRQSDYTKKTQEIARQREKQEVADAYYQAINSNPELAQKIAQQYNLPYVDPNQAQLIETTNKYNDLLLQQEIADLSNKHADFDARSVIEFALEHKLENLEHAYTLLSHQKGAGTSADVTTESETAPVANLDIKALTEEIRQSVLKELSSTVDTNSIIQSQGSGNVVVDNKPTLSEQEMRIAKNMKLSPEEYVKWRDPKTR